VNLMKAELRRALSRRLLRWLLLLTVLGAVGGGLLAFINSGGTHDPFSRDKLHGILLGTSGVLTVVAWLMGASLVGAEFPSRSMTTTLTYEPRRLRLFATKAVAAIVVAAAFSAVALAIITLAMTPANAAHGASNVGDPTIGSLFGVVGRAMVVSGVASAIGFAIAAIGRNTAAALGAGFGYVIVLEQIVGGVWAKSRRWLLLGNTIVFLSGKNSGGEVPGRTVTGAAMVLIGIAAAWLIGAGAAFTQRDVA
jgi:ABC-type transport system involved in multi-copper enzyme maturation permease subunit